MGGGTLGVWVGGFEGEESFPELKGGMREEEEEEEVEGRKGAGRMVR